MIFWYIELKYIVKINFTCFFLLFNVTAGKYKSSCGSHFISIGQCCCKSLHCVLTVGSLQRFREMPPQDASATALPADLAEALPIMCCSKSHCPQAATLLPTSSLTLPVRELLCPPLQMTASSWPASWSSVQFSRSVVSDSLWPHGLQHAKPSCPSPTPGVYSNSCSLSRMPSNHLILCHPLLLLPSIFPSIRVFSNESVLRIRWPKDGSFSFSFSPSNEYSGLISFRKFLEARWLKR